jgi:hypothetical protein
MKRAELMKQIKQYIKNEKNLQTSVIFCLFGGYHEIAVSSPAKKTKPTVSNMVSSCQKVFGSKLRS